MNSPHREPELTDDLHPPVALLGRVPTKVVGTVQKGDMMVTSDTAGHAEAWRDEGNPRAGSIIGKAVENKEGEDAGVIEVLINIG